MPRLRERARHTGLPASVRVRAAVALAVFGDRSAADVVLRAAQRPEPGQGEGTDMTRL